MIVQRLIEIRRIEDDAARLLSHLDTVIIIDAQRSGAIVGHITIRLLNLRITHELRRIRPHMHHVKHITGAQRTPGIANIVLAECHIYPSFSKFLDSGKSTTFGIGIKPSSQMHVHQRIAHKTHAGHPQQTEQLVRIRIVIGPHGSGMARGETSTHAGFISQCSKNLQIAG